ncbi:DUF4129 domain-containing protein [Neobacillus ginsengisoli]|uniref:DUF4129 domain-containing protein n=1 Tax=Neobacillus ginsengisoli TaxID=904295 RepID=A0ABT9Y0R7_9BACI|nr:DUF4129 domain-containing protein [Neobacillus ginsengisoli]MDQ0201424.1 hypothetical protein [Neobacillus ginsengisoli]
MLDSNHARNTLKGILNKKEYRVYYHDSKSWLETWWDKAKQRLAERLAKLFPSFESASNASVPILIAIIVAVIIGLAMTAFFIFRNVRRNRMLRDQKPLHSMKEINWSFQHHLIEAKKREALEEYTHSTRHLFLALLLYFHEKEWLVARIWKTNWEYYEELRKVNQQVAVQFFDLASFFDEVTYGERDVRKEEYLQFRMVAMKWLEENESILKSYGDRGEEDN